MAMQTSIQFRPRTRDLGMVMREVDEDLAIFLGITRLDSPPAPNGRGEEAFQASPPVAAANNKRPASSGARKPASRSGTPAKTKPSSRASSLRSSTSSKTAIPATSRSAKPAAPSTMSASDGSSSGRKTASVAIKTSVPTCRVSQTVKSKPSQMLSVSQNPPQNLKTSLPRRPASASRGRPNPAASLSSSSKAKPRQNSCSPTKLRAAHRNGSRAVSRSRGCSRGGGGGDDVNPVLMGTQMVERVVNMRKLAPPKQENVSLENPKKKSSHDNSGFGRSLSNRSLDMAIRHMDIRRSVSGNLRPVATSSGNQSSSSQSSSSGVAESPITSSSDSSMSSNCGNSYFLDGRLLSS